MQSLRGMWLEHHPKDRQRTICRSSFRNPWQKFGSNAIAIWENRWVDLRQNRNFNLESTESKASTMACRPRGVCDGSDRAVGRSGRSWVGIATSPSCFLSFISLVSHILVGAIDGLGIVDERILWVNVRDDRVCSGAAGDCSRKGLTSVNHIETPSVRGLR